MATINQIRKSIEVAERRLEKAKKNVEMYDVRATKAIERARKATGKEFDRANYTIVLSENAEWELRYSISSNLEFLYDNYKNVEREVRNIERLRAELANLEKANEPSSLVKTLFAATGEFRIAWIGKMMDWYGRHFDYIRHELPTAKAKFDRAKRIESEMRYFARRRYLYNILSNVKIAAAEIMMDKAALMLKDEYLEMKRVELEGDWMECVITLANKCQRFNVTESAIEVSEPEVTAKGFECRLTDDKDRVIDARIIWAAEFSEYVRPHTRYIVTERRIK